MTTKPSYVEINQSIDLLIKTVIEYYRVRSPERGDNSHAWAAATGLLSVMLADAIGECPSTVQNRFVARLDRRQKEYQQETIMEALKK